ncbi:hypothetical protein [Jeotgalicoccus sp. FSL K6-3177]|uniref:hypothetical protein n=1 Tax=Jeotgalicoccus sp. FSL K6-3177 TaxID=2921494 RepID=UPI0030FD2E3A
MKKKTLYPFVFCIIANTLVYLYFIGTTQEVRHWFLVPNYITGSLLIYMSIASYFESKYKFFAVKFIVFVFSFYFFTIVPLLTIKWNYFISNVMQPNDWNTWIGLLSVMNLIGIIIFILIQKLNIFNFKFKSWNINYKKFYIFSGLILVFSFLVQTYYYVSLGGISSYINLYSDRGNNEAFDDAGLIFTLTEAFPIVLGTLVIIHMKRKNYEPKWIWLVLFLIVIFIIRMYFGGLRGSRSNTIWAIFWITGLIHFWIRPINLKVITLGTVLLILFMNIYSVYKIHGSDFYEIFIENDERVVVLNENSTGFETIFLQDFGRTDTQSYLLYKNFKDENFNKASGETYLGTLTLFIPDKIDFMNFDRKARFGTDALYGNGSYENGLTSSKVYGLYGEAILNFGMIVGLLSFVFWGVTVNYINKLQHGIERYDARMIIIPLLLITSILMLINDSDNILFFLIKNGLIPFLLIFLSKKE